MSASLSHGLSALALLAAMGALQDGLEDGQAGLASGDRRDRQQAIEDLAKLGSEDAWSLVFDRGLDDPSPRVADEAQLRIGMARVDATLLELAEGKLGLGSRNAMVRLRVAEALGRMEGALPIAPFLATAKDKDERIRASGWYALEQRARMGAKALDVSEKKSQAALVKALKKAATGDRDPRARANALRCAGVLHGADWVTATPTLAQGLERFVDWRASASASKDPELRAAAVALADETDDAALVAALRDPAPGPAAIAIDRLASRGDARAMRALAQRLVDADVSAGEPVAAIRSALAERIVQHLRTASGLTIGPDGTRWRRWAADLPEDWNAKEGAERVAAADDAARTTTFFGLRVVSDGVVFLVDMSGSMWDDRKGPRRKDSVDLELARALEGLPESAQFDIVPYADAPDPWKGKLTPATARNVDRATATFLKSKLRGKGDFWSALLPVLEDPEVDTVVVLTDGAPTGGYRWNVKLMRTLLGDRNRHRRVVLHVVLFDAGRNLQRLWKDIANDSGGTLHVID